MASALEKKDKGPALIILGEETHTDGESPVGGWE